MLIKPPQKAVVFIYIQLQLQGDALDLTAQSQRLVIVATTAQNTCSKT